ncbi:MAG: methyltransferase domain-containing protein [Deferribacteraceae bacterium]|jgi:chemotaxis protein methyltransferase CheR|nr:methyltransferase domain-containing protein [Deferribacteraceae bacterium]
MLTNTIKIKDEEFFELKEIIYKASAITFAESKKYLLENRLSKRLQELNFNSFKEYLYYLKYDINRIKEMDTLLNLVTINETYFLRERQQMDHLMKSTIPAILTRGKKNIRIWSAACSTGEEPYSMAILLREYALSTRANYEIIGTDINTEVVDIAKKGVYRGMSFRGVPPNFQSTYFTQNGLVYEIKDEFKHRVRFQIGNLISHTLPAQVGKFDVIFCRNALIYFDIEGKQKVLDMFYNCLNTPGYLYLGHSESTIKIKSKFVLQNFGNGVFHIKE